MLHEQRTKLDSGVCYAAERGVMATWKPLNTLSCRSLPGCAKLSDLRSPSGKPSIASAKSCLHGNTAHQTSMQHLAAAGFGPW
jgi:hypothetical protein